MKKTPAIGKSPAPTRRRAVPRGIPLSIDPTETAKLAYTFWQARGANGGSPEDDWYRAEQEIRTRQPVNGS
jgi:hypothetical protein